MSWYFRTRHTFSTLPKNVPDFHITRCIQTKSLIPKGFQLPLAVSNKKHRRKTLLVDSPCFAAITSPNGSFLRGLERATATMISSTRLPNGYALQFTDMSRKQSKLQERVLKAVYAIEESIQSFQQTFRSFIVPSPLASRLTRLIENTSGIFLYSAQNFTQSAPGNAKTGKWTRFTLFGTKKEVVDAFAASVVERVSGGIQERVTLPGLVRGWPIGVIQFLVGPIEKLTSTWISKTSGGALFIYGQSELEVAKAKSRLQDVLSNGIEQVISISIPGFLSDKIHTNSLKPPNEKTCGVIESLVSPDFHFEWSSSGNCTLWIYSSNLDKLQSAYDRVHSLLCASSKCETIQIPRNYAFPLNELLLNSPHLTFHQGPPSLKNFYVTACDTQVLSALDALTEIDILLAKLTKNSRTVKNVPLWKIGKLLGDQVNCLDFLLAGTVELTGNWLSVYVSVPQGSNSGFTSLHDSVSVLVSSMDRKKVYSVLLALEAMKLDI
ncbi:hypothetical protein BABINDRAFT_82588 [Babjeviella inositovora NRRL Y-12698]|uniref:Uncharacterized protein n=1 Tax=Babjeviella inositovora NRRL Y-12698 TaxID=984486 RepID=A0A1E3R053_9ASCO|nr:uncharacterized protein BABINDRAFT_82588 [Babjeviella inositovora NRRL Y-12698]ODQ83235.1 hypothetical protein BABINDRAFT_82588 [Babjeviella inositovora NRRL Y-12698]